jgi:BirA family transcriptional regulator, biotin operon repressor / biotin---[acetyl-CoA-carboxylase] ligase
MTAAAGSLHWQADALWQQLLPQLPGLSVEVLAQVDSTNTLLLERARAGSGRRQDDAQPGLVVAEHQTLGRGRQARAWHAAPRASLTFSLGLPLAPRDWSGLSLAVGVALADALDAPEPGRAGPRIALKWPNDLWLAGAAPAGAGRGRKLGGVLIETVAVGARRMVVVGVGLNIEPLPQTAPSAPQGTDFTMLAPHGTEFSHGYACLQELDRDASAPAVLHRVALPLVRAVRQFEREGFAGFAAAFARRDLLRSQAVRVQGSRGEAAVEGVAQGVTPHGALRVQDGAGVAHEVGSGEVSVRFADAPASAPAPLDTMAPR